jgi:FkbM family methyltransferase
MIEKAKTWIRRKMNSWQFGVPFTRSGRIEVPESIPLAEQDVRTATPDEHGVKADFSTIFLDDSYGLLSTDLGADRPHILDVGANIGLFGVAARRLYPSATIHAYEPAPALEQYLRHHAREAGYSYFMEAVGANEGTAELVREGDSNQTQVQRRETGTTPVVSLQTAVDRLDGSVDLLKLDCEGGEWELFDAPGPWASIRWVTMEYHLWATSGVRHQDLPGKVQDLGFEVVEHRYDPDVDFGMLRARRR